MRREESGRDHTPEAVAHLVDAIPADAIPADVASAEASLREVMARQVADARERTRLSTAAIRAAMGLEADQ